MGLPKGPGSIDELMRWPVYHAEQLLLKCNQASDNRRRFRDLLKYKIVTYESYSGMGTGSVTLHMQYKQMLRTMSNELIVWFGICKLPLANSYTFISQFGGFWLGVCFFADPDQGTMSSHEGTPLSAVGVHSSSACDADTHCRKVLASLKQDT